MMRVSFERLLRRKRSELEYVDSTLEFGTQPLSFGRLHKSMDKINPRSCSSASGTAELPNSFRKASNIEVVVYRMMTMVAINGGDVIKRGMV